MSRRTGTTAPAGLVLISVLAAGCGGRAVTLGDGVGGADGGSADGAPCAHAQIQASEILWIGDSWIQIPGSQHTRVRDLARASGAIGPNDDYVVAAAGGTTMAMIADQYDAREAGATKVKVLIMDGGGWDTILSGGSDVSVAGVGQALTRLLTTTASDGTVQNIIYFLYPELPSIPGVAALRPVVQQACSASAIPCHFLDLQPLWDGHPEYTARDTIQASDAGGQIIGDAIWSIMQLSCIAQ